MWRHFQFSYRYGYVIVGLVFLLTAFLAQKAIQVRIDVSSETLVPAESELQAQYEHVRELFGSDRIAIIFAADDDLFNAVRLARLRTINDELERLPYVEKVDSLFTLADIRNVDDFLESSPLLETIPSDPEELAQRQQFAIENPILRRNVISDDGNATVLTVMLKPEEEAGLSTREIYDEIEALILRHRQHFGELYQMGEPALQTNMMDLLKRDQTLLLPLAALALILLLSINLRSLIGGLMPVVNAFIATVWTLGTMTMLDIPLNLLNYILPVLILVVGATEDVHLLHEYRENLRHGHKGELAMKKTGSAIILALILTGVTTVLGFASTTLSELPILQHFGLAAVIGMSYRLFISLVFFPACLRIIHPAIAPTGQDKKVEQEGGKLSGYIASKIMTRIVPHPRILAILIILIAAPSIYNASNINLSNDLISFLKQDSPIVKQLNELSERLSGTKVLYLTLYDNPDGFVNPATLKQLDDITAYLRELPETDTVTSFADIVSRINEQLYGGDPARRVIPDKTSTIRQLLLLAHPKDFASYISPDYAIANIVIRCQVNDSTRLNAFLDSIRTELDSGRFGAKVYTLTGSAALVAAGVDSITETQVLSLGSMSFVLFVIVSILFVSFRCGILTVLSNLFSIALIFGFMGLLGISLNVGTCMVAAITLGLAIDDTLHLLVRYSKELKTFKDEKKGIEASLRAEMTPIVSTSLALAGGFLVLMFSSFEPVRQFGALSAGVILLALAADLIITPVLIASVRLVTLWDIIGLNLRKALLKKSPLFKNLTSWQAKKIILATDVEEYRAGSVVIRKGDIGDKMYLVLSGELEVVIYRNDEKVPIAPLKLGDVFGEIALVTQETRTADIVALTDTRLLALDSDSLERLRRFSPYLASHLFFNLAHILAERLAEGN